jgi:hypothetical protein
LPPYLTHLTLGKSINQALDNLPKSLKSLTVKGSLFNNPVPSLPQLTFLTIESTAFTQPIDHLHITYLACNQPIHNLPPTITHLVIRYTLNLPIPSLPQLTHLTIESDSFTQPLDHLHITHLIFGEYFNQLIHSFPHTITHLTFGHNFDHPISGQLPCSLQSLELGDNFFSPLHSLPASLKILTGVIIV